MEIEIIQTKTLTGKLSFSIRYITNRQDLIKEHVLRIKGFKPYMIDRLDMYWIDAFIDKERIGSACVEPDLRDKKWFTINNQFIEVNHKTWETIRKEMVNFFMNTLEHKSQMIWTQNLIDAGYKGLQGTPCKICNSYFIVQNKHLHRLVISQNKIYPYHKSMRLAGKQEILTKQGKSFKKKRYNF